MPRRPDRAQCRAAERDRVTVLELAIDFHRFPSLVAERGDVLTRRERLCVLPDRHDLRAGRLLHRGVTAHVIEMGVAGQHDLDVPQIEPQLLPLAVMTGVIPSSRYRPACGLAAS